jgi:tryptophanyl-tRNA synthetase
MINYPAYQIVPTFFENKRCLIPSAIDQDPYWRIQRDIAESLGYQKAAAIHSKFLPPLNGVDGKMSSSINESAIWLTDDEKSVIKKVNKYAFSGGKQSIEEHRKLGGDTSIDVSYQWLSIFFEPDNKRLSKIKSDYESGKMLSGEMKQIVSEKINTFLEEHTKKLEKIDVDKFTTNGRLAKEMWNREYL